MKVVRTSFLGVLVGVLLLTIFLTLYTKAASQVSPKVSINSLSPATSIQKKVVNANSIVYWRSDPDWNTSITLAQQGVYTGDTVALACYTRGSTVPPSNNDPLWYWAEVVSGHGQDSGWVNGYFLNTETNQPNIPVNDVISCPKDPYIWFSGPTNILALPGASSVLETPRNGDSIGPFCWIDGGWLKGNYWTNRWFQVPVHDWWDAYHGYINASFVANRHTLPYCDSNIGTQVTPVSTVTLAQGPVYSGNAYRYAITLSGFPKNATISVKCYDSVSPSGFSPFTMTTNANGDGFTQSKCYSGDGPDHWVVAGWITSNHIQWRGGSASNSQPLAAKVTLAQGPVYSGNGYRYAITLSGFPANTPVSVECYDSVSPSGFFHFTMTTDGSGNASTQSECYSGDGPDHWVVAGGVTSNHIQWGGGSTSNPQLPMPTPSPTAMPMPTPSPPSQPIDAYSNYGPANTGYPICRGNPSNPQSIPGGMVSQTFTVPAGVASLNSALVQIDPDSTVTAHLSLIVNGNVVATADAITAGDTQFWFGPVYVSAGDVITLSISFTATYGKIITVYSAGAPGGTFTISDSCPAGASNVSITSTGLRAKVSGMS